MPTHSAYKFQPDTFTRMAAVRDLPRQHNEPYRTLDESLQAATEGYLATQESWALVTAVIFASTAVLALVPLFSLT